MRTVGNNTERPASFHTLDSPKRNIFNYLSDTSLFASAVKPLINRSVTLKIQLLY